MSEQATIPAYDFSHLPVGEFLVKRLPAGYLSLHTKSAHVDAPAVDTQRLSVPCVITTQDEDREKDVILTAGIDLVNHRANPLVMLDHGLFMEGNTYPAVARAEDPEGNYTVSLEPGKGKGVSWFSSKVQDSYQTFQLIAEGFLRGVSIGFRGIQVEYRKDHPAEYRGWPGLLVARCELLEYSHCPMGINPYALADRIGKGYLGSERLTPMLWKSMSAHLPVLKEQVPAQLPENLIVPATTPTVPVAQSAIESTTNDISDGGKSVSVNTAATGPAPAATAGTASAAQTQVASTKTTAPSAAQTKAQATATKADDKDKDKDGDKGDGMNQTSGSDGGNFVPLDDGKGDKPGDKPGKKPDVDAGDDSNDSDDSDADAEEDPTKDWLPGARVLAGCYALMTGLGQFLAEGASQQENPAIREALDAYTEQTQGMQTHCAETFRSNYADYDPLDKASGENDDGADMDDGDDRRDDGKSLGISVVKHILAKHPVHGRWAKGLSLAEALAQKTAECERYKAEVEKYKTAAEKAVTHLEQLQFEVRKKSKRK